MSCWLLGDPLICRMVDFLKYEQHNYGWGKAIVPVCHLSEQKIGEKLRAMNYKAFDDRYDGRHQEGVEPFKYVDIRGEKHDVYQHLKDIRCYLYQCSEGGIPRRKLYKQLKELAETIEDAIISKLPEYEAAKWGE